MFMGLKTYFFFLFVLTFSSAIYGQTIKKIYSEKFNGTKWSKKMPHTKSIYYNNKNQVTKEITHSELGDTTTIYEYNIINQLVKTESFIHDTLLTGFSRFYYSPKGFLVRENNYNPNEELISRYIYGYNKKGQLAETQYFLNNELKWRFNFYEYSDSLCITKVRIIYKRFSRIAMESWTMKYDEQGVLKRIIKRNSKTKRDVEEISYYYSLRKNQLTRQITFNGIGTPLYKESYKYEAIKPKEQDSIIKNKELP
jgi:hypothetical protein